MGRHRAETEPFWATSLDNMQPNVADIVVKLDDIIDRSPLLAPYLWMGSGWRTGSVEHGSGRAIDVMFTPTTNRQPTLAEEIAAELFVAWVVDNAKDLGLQWILYAIDGKTTHSFNPDRGTWKKLDNRGSISANHIDHAHLYFKPGAKMPHHLVDAVIADPTPAPKGLLGMTHHVSHTYGKAQQIKGEAGYLRAHPKGWWWLHQRAGLTAISVHGYANAGPNCSIFILAVADAGKGKSRVLGRAQLPNGSGSFEGSALATLNKGEVVWLQARNHSGKPITIQNVTTNIMHA